MEDSQHSKKEIDQYLRTLAYSGSSSTVRLALASGLQRIDLSNRYYLAQNLLRYHDDSLDPYLPLMIWYGIEPLIPSSTIAGRVEVQNLLVFSRTPLLREYIARRIGASTKELDPLIEILEPNAPPFQRDVLRGLKEAIKDRRSVPMPGAWKGNIPDPHRKSARRDPRNRAGPGCAVWRRTRPDHHAANPRRRQIHHAASAKTPCKPCFSNAPPIWCPPCTTC